jgi:CheY-like chemotaxis protein
LSPDLGRIHADPSQIEQALLNLILNAREAMPNGGTITLATERAECPAAEAAAGRRPGVYAMLSVTDTGKGIDNEIRSLLFDPFFTTKEQREGAGLGLSAVYGTVEQHGGFIRVSSEPGKGARFEVYLPQCPDSDDPPEFDSMGLRGRETILVVEDENIVLRLVSETLRAYGYTVLESSDSAAALEMARREEVMIDVLLTDLVMPNVNGRALAEGWKARRPELKVLFMSGYGEDPMTHQRLDGPHVTLLQKPFSSFKLARTIREVLDGAES